MDLLTQRRIMRFIEEFRRNKAQLPTLKDFAAHGFSEEVVQEAEKKKVIEKFYVTLTNGSIVKGYKVKK